MILGKEFVGRVCLLTGAAGGIGREIAAQLDAAGIRLVLSDVNADGLNDLARSLKHEALPVSGDLRDMRVIEQLYETVDKAYGHLDILINNAAVVRTDRFDEYSSENIQADIAINLTAPLLLTNKFLPLLKKSVDPRIINTVSLGGVLPMPESPIYTATKFGLRGATLAMAIDLKKKGIRVGGILPSAVDTAQLRHEALTGGSALNFLSPPQKPSHVADELVRMLMNPKYERYPNAPDAFLSRLVMFFPNHVGRMMGLLERMGQKGRRKYLEERKLLDQVVRW